MPKNVENSIREKLAQALQFSVLEIANESAKHSGHAGDNGSGESHFRVLVVSDDFLGKNRIERQRMIYDVLKDEMVNKIHALSIVAKTTGEYRGV